MEKTASVIILNYNGKEYIQSCVSSVLKQDFTNYEVVIVDNGSLDGSLEIIEKNFPEVRIIRNERNLGYAAGNNVGICATRSKYLAFLNNDTEVKTNWLSTMIQVAESNSNVGMVASKVLYLDDKRIIHTTGVLVSGDFTPLSRGINQKDNGQFDKREEIFSPHGASMLIRRKMLDEVGLFDEDYFCYREEDELAWRGHLAGYRCIYEPKSVCYHKRGASSGRSSNFVLFYTERNRLFTVIKIAPISLIIRSLPITLQRYLYTIKNPGLKNNTKMGKTNMALTVIYAWWRAIPFFYKMWKKRKGMNISAKQRKKIVEMILNKWGYAFS